MKKRYNFLLVLSLPISLLLFSYVGGSPGGKSGSPGDNGATCTDCHAGTAQSQNSWITSTIPNEGYIPGETYQITATGTHAGVVKFGFELTAEDLSGSKTGSFVITDATRSKLANGGKSVTHKSSGVTPTGNMNSWTVDWIAPFDAGDVAFYAAYNAANGNGATSGDIIYTSSLVVSELVLNPQITGVDPGHAPLDFSGELNITGMDTDWMSGVSEVKFVHHDIPADMFTANDIQKINNTLLTVTVSIPSVLTVGTYDVYVDDLMLENGFVVDQLDAVDQNVLADQISLFPNPTSDRLSLKAPLGSNIIIADLQGRVMITTIVNQSVTQLDVSGYPSGLYLLSTELNGQVSTQKWLKN